MLEERTASGWYNAPFGAPHLFWFFRVYNNSWDDRLIPSNENVLECMQILARAGIDPCECMPDTYSRDRIPSSPVPGSNLLHYFGATNKVYKQAYEIVHWLVEQGVDINAENKHGMRPLMYAVRANNATHVRVLVANGADMYLNVKRKKEVKSIFDHSDTGRSQEARSVLVSFSGWSPSIHHTLSEEKKQRVRTIMNIYSWGGYDESAPQTRVHDLPRELMFEIIGLSLFGTAPTSVGDGLTLAESGEAHPFDWLEGDEQE
eukprot:TRINITY_DN2815_c0_g1_i1.p1 TRINITY_DN2815_c0_g1~~TRINITY_DN2815_c0_g1_i1.p1  ORF type:complete len:287 (-),score=30.31 TRINITY_DN2815_c0_g1_i1:224-1006(-)